MKLCLRKRVGYLLSKSYNIFTVYTGKDATEAFEDVGHSDEARALLDGLYVGDFEKGGVSARLLLPRPT
jgi:cytochrome b involved in lipid metabolism